MGPSLYDIVKAISGHEAEVTVGPGMKEALELAKEVPLPLGEPAPNNAPLSDFSNASATSEVSKQIEDFKKFMQQDVEALAAQDKEDAAKLQILRVRGREMVVSKVLGHNRTIAVMMAAIYNANIPGIDDVLHQSGARGNFLHEGEVRVEHFVSDPPGPVTVAHPSAPPADGKRNILIEDASPEKDALPRTGNLLVAITDLDGRVRSLGRVIAWDVELAGGYAWHRVANILTGVEFPVREDYLTEIRSTDQLKKITAEITPPQESVNDGPKSV